MYIEGRKSASNYSWPTLLALEEKISSPRLGIIQVRGLVLAFDNQFQFIGVDARSVITVGPWGTGYSD